MISAITLRFDSNCPPIMDAESASRSSRRLQKRRLDVLGMWVKLWPLANVARRLYSRIYHWQCSDILKERCSGVDIGAGGRKSVVLYPFQPLEHKPGTLTMVNELLFPLRMSVSTTSSSTAGAGGEFRLQVIEHQM